MITQAKLISIGIRASLVLAVFSYGHSTGRQWEQAKIKKSAAKAVERAEDADSSIAGIQDEAAPVLKVEEKTIIQYDRAAAIELGKVQGELESLKARYENIILGDWGERDLPNVVRDEISEIDNLLSRL